MLIHYTLCHNLLTIKHCHFEKHPEHIPNRAVKPFLSFALMSIPGCNRRNFMTSKCPSAALTCLTTKEWQKNWWRRMDGNKLNACQTQLAKLSFRLCVYYFHKFTRGLWFIKCPLKIYEDCLVWERLSRRVWIHPMWGGCFCRLLIFKPNVNP